MPSVRAPLAPARPLEHLIEREHRRHRRRRIVWWLLLAAVPLVAGLLFFAMRPRTVAMPARFRSQPATTGDVVREVHATGHVEAVTTVQVGAEISGRIESVDADYNDNVKAGQVLARFDRAALEAQLAQARATVASSKAALEQAKTDRDQAERNAVRAKQLVAQKIISDQDYEAASSAARLAAQRVSAAQATLVAQQSAYDLARTNRTHAEIRSPIDGVVITRNIDSGQTVASVFQTPVLFTVAADLQKMQVVANVDEADIGEVRVGEQAVFTVSAFPDREFSGTVTEVRNSPVIVQDVVTYGTVIAVANPDLVLRPGMTASARIITASKQNVLRVASAALHFTPPGEATSAKPSVWVLEGNQLRRIEVRPGISDGENTELEGTHVAGGTRVLTELTPEGRKAYGISR